MTICILGRQPRLGLAELEALYGADAIEPLGKEAALLEVDPRSVPHGRLGGTIKVAKLVTTLHSTDWGAAMQHINTILPRHLTHLPEGKLTIGLSVYGLRVSPQRIGHEALQLKKALRASGRPVRIVPNNDLTLNSAQVWHNNLTEDLGIELLLVAHRGRTYIARTFSVQHIDSYARRDFDRPKRDARVGMLPPKLAQIMLNLAKPHPHDTVLDPFCGTGVVLMEAALQGYAIEGSDISQKMVDYTRANLAWLQDNYHVSPQIKELSRADATTHEWRKSIDAVVCETYLGQPLTKLPDRAALQPIIAECDHMIRNFLVNMHRQLTTNARCCIAVPAWKNGQSFMHLPLIDDLRKIGYNRVSFSHANNAQLIYHRPEQVVARELLVLTPEVRK